MSCPHVLIEIVGRIVDAAGPPLAALHLLSGANLTFSTRRP